MIVVRHYGAALTVQKVYRDSEGDVTGLAVSFDGGILDVDAEYVAVKTDEGWLTNDWPYPNQGYLLEWVRLALHQIEGA